MEKETKVLNLDESIQEVAAPAVKTKGSALKYIGLVGSGAASGGLFLGLTKDSEITEVAEETEETEEESEDITKPEAVASEVPDESPVANLKIATLVTSDMNFGQAFAAARAEVGAGGYFMYHGGWYGTYYAGEWAGMTSEEKTTFSEAIFHHPNHEYFEQGGEHAIQGIVIYDVAPVATWVIDDMPIADAHIIARMEVGPGGIFVHDGKTYSTYYPSELAQMSPEQHQLFIDSIERADISPVVHETGIDVGSVAIIEVDTSELIYDDPQELQIPSEGEVLEKEIIPLEDGKVLIGEAIDTDDNGIPDVFRMTDPETNESVEVKINEETGDIIDIYKVESSLLSDVEIINNETDIFADTTYSDEFLSAVQDGDFDTNADVTPYT